MRFIDETSNKLELFKMNQSLLRLKELEEKQMEYMLKEAPDNSFEDIKDEYIFNNLEEDGVYRHARNIFGYNEDAKDFSELDIHASTIRRLKNGKVVLTTHDDDVNSSCIITRFDLVTNEEEANIRLNHRDGKQRNILFGTNRNKMAHRLWRETNLIPTSTTFVYNGTVYKTNEYCKGNDDDGPAVFKKYGHNAIEEMDPRPRGMAENCDKLVFDVMTQNRRRIVEFLDDEFPEAEFCIGGKAPGENVLKGHFKKANDSKVVELKTSSKQTDTDTENESNENNFNDSCIIIDGGFRYKGDDDFKPDPLTPEEEAFLKSLMRSPRSDTQEPLNDNEKSLATNDEKAFLEKTHKTSKIVEFKPKEDNSQGSNILVGHFGKDDDNNPDDDFEQ